MVPGERCGHSPPAPSGDDICRQRRLRVDASSKEVPFCETAQHWFPSEPGQECGICIILLCYADNGCSCGVMEGGARPWLVMRLRTLEWLVVKVLDQGGVWMGLLEYIGEEAAWCILVGE